MGDDELLLDEELGDLCDYSDGSPLLEAMDTRLLDEVRRACAWDRRYGRACPSMRAGSWRSSGGRGVVRGPE